MPDDLRISLGERPGWPYGPTRAALEHWNAILGPTGKRRYYLMMIEIANWHISRPSFDAASLANCPCLATIPYNPHTFHARGRACGWETLVCGVCGSAITKGILLKNVSSYSRVVLNESNLQCRLCGRSLRWPSTGWRTFELITLPRCVNSSQWPELDGQLRDVISGALDWLSAYTWASEDFRKELKEEIFLTLKRGRAWDEEERSTGLQTIRNLVNEEATSLGVVGLPDSLFAFTRSPTDERPPYCEEFLRALQAAMQSALGRPFEAPRNS